MIRVLYMNAKADDPDTVDAEVAAVAAHLGAGAVVTSGLADFNARARSDGGWHGWISRTPGRYDLFVVPGVQCGKATMQICTGALTAGKKVLLLPMSPERVIGAAKAVVRIIPGADWRAGYVAETA